jgi:lipopolysaccharide transport system permease protein
VEIAASLWRNRDLVFQLTKREVLGRYRGSLMGLGWSLFHPIIMLTIYTFVFSVVFRAKWPGLSDDRSMADFALLIFAGMIMHGIFAECINRAPGLILSNPNYVKKVVFPLEILPWVAMASAVFHAGVSVAVMLMAQVLVDAKLPWTATLFPVVLLPLLLIAVGSAWFLSSLGVFIRDIVQITGFITTILLFVSPVFFPVSAVPDQFQPWLKLNPLTFVIESTRSVLIYGRTFDWLTWTCYVMVGLTMTCAGFWWFQKTRRGFADVL